MRLAGWVSAEAVLPKPVWADLIEDDFNCGNLMEIVSGRVDAS